MINDQKLVNYIEIRIIEIKYPLKTLKKIKCSTFLKNKMQETLF